MNSIAVSGRTVWLSNMTIIFPVADELTLGVMQVIRVSFLYLNTVNTIHNKIIIYQVLFLLQDELTLGVVQVIRVSFLYLNTVNTIHNKIIIYQVLFLLQNHVINFLAQLITSHSF